MAKEFAKVRGTLRYILLQVNACSLKLWREVKLFASLFALQAFKEAVTLQSTGPLVLEDIPPYQIWNEV